MIDTRDSGNQHQSITFFGRDDVVMVVALIALVLSLGAGYIALSMRAEIAQVRTEVATVRGDVRNDVAVVRTEVERVAGQAQRAFESTVIAEREARLAQRGSENQEVEIKTLRAVLEAQGMKLPEESRQ